jgi:integrase
MARAPRHQPIASTHQVAPAAVYGAMRPAAVPGSVAPSTAMSKGRLPGNSKRVHKIKPLTLPELEALVAAMPERLRLLVLLAAWCGLRFGELTELRRSDIDMKWSYQDQALSCTWMARRLSGRRRVTPVSVT